MMKYNNGSTTIEFALGGIFLILCTFMVLEMAYRIHVNNAVEYALREAVRATLVHEGEAHIPATTKHYQISRMQTILFGRF